MDVSHDAHQPQRHQGDEQKEKQAEEEAAERLTEEVLLLRQQLIDLTHRRNAGHQASHLLTNENPASSVYICMGDFFLRTHTAEALHLITRDDSCLDKEIETVREALKNKILLLQSTV